MAHPDTQLADLYRAYRPKILRYLARLVGAADAEDLTQLTFIKAAQGLPGFRGEATVATWIYRIATNVAVDRLRSRIGQELSPLRELPQDDMEFDASSASHEIVAPSLETEAIRSEMSECVSQFVDQLPESYRTVVVLSDVEGFKNREIADIVGASLETVKIRLHRARAELRNKLERGCDFYRDEQNEFTCDRKPVGDLPATLSPVSFLVPDPSTGEKGGVSWSSKIESEH
jgi:RNA polymerase sigma-70 factor (ECF subfamily)